MKRLWLVVMAGVFSIPVFANVYDDAIWWFNSPMDKDGDAVIDQGEVVDILHGGILDHVSNSGVPKGVSYVSSETIVTPSFLRTLPCLKLQDPKGGNGAWVDISAPINAVHQEKEAFSGVVRFNWDGVTHGTSWMLKLGANTEGKGSLLVGVYNGAIRIYPDGGDGAISELPVVADTWYDFGYVITKLPTDGCSVRFVLRKEDGTTYTYEKNYAVVLGIPAANSDWRIGTESGRNTKYFTGLIQQVAFWDRGLSDKELIAAFDYQPPSLDEAGVSNASGAEFGGGANASVTFGSSAWKDYPSLLVKGMDASFSFTTDETPCAYAFRVKSATGSATLKATAGGQEATAEIAEGETADLFFSQDAFMVGTVNTITLTRVDDGGAFIPDSFVLLRRINKPIVHIDNEVVSTPLVIATDHLQQIEVAEGKVVVYSGIISGFGVAIRKTGLGTLKFAANNTFDGGITVAAGRILCDDATLTTPFGTGAVKIEQNGLEVCQAAVAGTLANNFIFNGSSTEAFPGLHFADVTTLSGTVDAEGDLWITTAWNNTASYADTEQVTLKGQFTVAGTFAMAPHCKVNFTKTISCDTLDLRWAPNSATIDGGNPGAVVLASCGDKTTGIACPMRKVRIDQTRVIQGGFNIFGGRNVAPFGMAEVEWTGLHKTGGSIDLAVGKMGLGKVITPPTTADDETSMTIFYSGSQTPYLNFYETQTSTNYLRIVGNINVSLATSGSVITFANRHHRCSAQFIAGASKGVVTGSTRFDVPVIFTANSRKSEWVFDGLTDPEALRKVMEINMSSYGTVTFDSVACASLPQDYSLVLTSVSGGDPIYNLPSVDSILKVKRFLDVGIERNPGKYQESDRTTRLQSHIYPSGAQIWVSVADDTEASGTLTWDAENKVWKDGFNHTVTDTAFARYETVTCAFTGVDGAAIATLPDTLFTQDLDLTTTGGGVKTLVGALNSDVQVRGDLSLSDGVDYVFKPRMALAQAKTFALGAERFIAFDGGLSLTGTGTNVIESGTVSVYKELNGAILVKGGATLALNGSVYSNDNKPIIMETKASAPYPVLLLNGVTLKKPVVWGTGRSQGTFIFDAVGDKTVTNVFVGRMTQSEGSTAVHLRSGYTYEIQNANFAGKHEFCNIGRNVGSEETTVICGESLGQAYRGGDGYLYARDSVHLVLDCTKCLNSRLIGADANSSVVEFCRDEVFSSNLTMPNASVLSTGDGKLLLNRTYQKCSALQGNAMGKVSGEADSTIEICLGNDTTYSGAFEGEVSIVMNGTGKQILSGVSTSTGAVIIKQGTLEFDTTASWTNASKVVLKGGTLSVRNRRAFGFDSTELILAGGRVAGHVKFGSGNVKTADGSILLDGVYGPESGWVSEGGSVTIGKRGIIILVR